MSWKISKIRSRRREFAKEAKQKARVAKRELRRFKSLNDREKENGHG